MSSIVFIGTPEKSERYQSSRIKNLFFINPYDLTFRMFASFMPPFGKYRRVYVDFLGPSIAFLLLAAILNHGYSYKLNKISLGPSEFLFCYTLVVPIVCYALIILGRSDITFIELLSLLGYALYSHVFTIAISYLCFHESSNAFFFLCMTLFCGLSTFRLIIVLLKTIPYPGPRLVICSLVAVVQILTLIFLHFAYMHRTFIYGKRRY